MRHCLGLDGDGDVDVDGFHPWNASSGKISSNVVCRRRWWWQWWQWWQLLIIIARSGKKREPGSLGGSSKLPGRNCTAQALIMTKKEGKKEVASCGCGSCTSVRTMRCRVENACHASHAHTPTHSHPHTHTHSYRLVSKKKKLRCHFGPNAECRMPNAIFQHTSDRQSGKLPARE